MQGRTLQIVGMKKPITRTTIGVLGSRVREAERMLGKSELPSAFPGIGRPTKKKIYELAVELGMDEIDRRMRKVSK